MNQDEESWDSFRAKRVLTIDPQDGIVARCKKVLEFSIAEMQYMLFYMLYCDYKILSKRTKKEKKMTEEKFKATILKGLNELLELSFSEITFIKNKKTKKSNTGEDSKFEDDAIHMISIFASHLADFIRENSND